MHLTIINYNPISSLSTSITLLIWSHSFTNDLPANSILLALTTILHSNFKPVKLSVTKRPIHFLYFLCLLYILTLIHGHKHSYTYIGMNHSFCIHSFMPWFYWTVKQIKTQFLPRTANLFDIYLTHFSHHLMYNVQQQSPQFLTDDLFSTLHIKANTLIYMYLCI